MPRHLFALVLPAFLLAFLQAFVLAIPCTGVQAQPLATIPALDSPVVDTTGTLDAATRQQLQAQALALQQRKGSQLQVLVVPSTQPETIEAYAVRAFEQWKLGRQGVDDGVLLVVAKDDRKVRIEVGYGLEGAIPDVSAGRVIQEYLVPKFRAGDFAGGVLDATGMLVRLIDGEPLPAPMAEPDNDGTGGSWLWALFVAFIVARFIGVFAALTPAPVRAVLAAGGGGWMAWVISSAWPVAVGGALIGIMVGLVGVSGGRFARGSGRGGGSWGSYGGGSSSSGGGWSSGGSSSGGWSGGGGSSGGGGASGSW